MKTTKYKFLKDDVAMDKRGNLYVVFCSGCCGVPMLVRKDRMHKSGLLQEWFRYIPETELECLGEL